MGLSACRTTANFSLLLALVLTSPFQVVAGERNEADLRLSKGDHVIFIGNTFADQLRVSGYVETLLAIRYPNLDLTFRNLGWSGDSLSLQPRPLNFGSLDEHLTQQSADVIIACFGMNESFDGPDGIERFRGEWESLIGHFSQQTYNGKSAPRLVMISPIAHEQLNRRMGDAQRHNQNLALYTDCMRSIARQTETPFVDLFEVTRTLLRQGSSQRLTKNGIHLNQYGYWVVSQAIADAIGPKVQPWKIEVDASALRLEAQGTVATSLGVKGDILQFTVSDIFLPVPLPPEGSRVHASLAARQSRLIVKNLPPGTYELRVDGQKVAIADKQVWAKGIALISSPSHRRSNELRHSVTKKNAQFFYRWRASNSEYIFGRRAKPFGVISFPPEMQQLGQIILTKDHQTWPLTAPLKEQRWQLVPVEM